jgi:CRISPR-associated protein Cas8a1/Csx13
MGGKMAKRVTKKATSHDTKELTINLFGPGMTVIHKVGLAGLWMTLKALEDENDGHTGFDGIDGSWERTDTSVTFRWNEAPDSFFKTLFARSFKIDKNGLLWFPALGEPMNNPQQSVILQEAMLGSILQHGQTRKADPSRTPSGSIAIEIDGTTITLRFHKISNYAHQLAAFNFAGINSLAGWQFPGGVVRHTGLQGSTALEEPPDRALALRFTPAGVIFFEMRTRRAGVRPRYALVLPEIPNLSKYARARRVFLNYGVHQLYASGTAEAGFRVLAELKAAALMENIRAAKCRVVSFGTVPWSTQQKTRVNLMTVQARSALGLRTFNLCRQVLAPSLVRPKKGDPFWDMPQVPDLVARNLAEGKLWWQGFADFVADQERRKHIFTYEKGGLVKMVEDTKAFPQGPERLFVMACHDAWRRRMGQIGEKAKREHSDFGSQVNREFERVRVSFSRCKNAASLRESITDFWARGGGPLKPLQDSWSDILVLLDNENWQKARDLVLLALASYKPATKEETEALEGPDISKEGGE